MASSCETRSVFAFTFSLLKHHSLFASRLFNLTSLPFLNYKEQTALTIFHVQTASHFDRDGATVVNCTGTGSVLA
jgi:hypothetical protein